MLSIWSGVFYVGLRGTVLFWFVGVLAAFLRLWLFICIVVWVLLWCWSFACGIFGCRLWGWYKTVFGDLVGLWFWILWCVLSCFLCYLYWSIVLLFCHFRCLLFALACFFMVLEWWNLVVLYLLCFWVAKFLSIWYCVVLFCRLVLVDLVVGVNWLELVICGMFTFVWIILILRFLFGFGFTFVAICFEWFVVCFSDFILWCKQAWLVICIFVVSFCNFDLFCLIVTLWFGYVVVLHWLFAYVICFVICFICLN